MKQKINYIEFGIYIVLFIAVLLRVVAFATMQPIIFNDTASYVFGSKEIFEKFTFANLGDQRPFLYPAIIGTIYSLADDSNKMVMLVQLIIGIATTYIFYKLCCKVFVNRLLVFIAMLLYVGDIHLLKYEVTIVADSIHVFASLLYVYLFILLVEKRIETVDFKSMAIQLLHAIMVGVVFCGAVLLRQISQFNLFILIIFVVIYFILGKQFYKQIIFRRIIEAFGIFTGFFGIAYLVAAKMKTDWGEFCLSGTVTRFQEYFQGQNDLERYFSLPLGFLYKLTSDPIMVLKNSLVITSKYFIGDELSLGAFPSYYISVWLLVGIILWCIIGKNRIETVFKKTGKIYIGLFFSLIVLPLMVSIAYWAQTPLAQKVYLVYYRLNVEPFIIILLTLVLYQILVVKKWNQFFEQPVSEKFMKSFFRYSAICLITLICIAVLISPIHRRQTSVIGSIPWQSQDNVSCYTRIAWAFSDSMDKKTIEQEVYLRDITDGDLITGTISWYGDSMLIFLPNELLKSNHTYEFGLRKPGISKGGNAVRANPIHFSTEQSQGVVKPYIGCDRRK